MTAIETSARVRGLSGRTRRVLVIHNRYRSEAPSGENLAVDLDIELLDQAGLAVDSYLRHSDELVGAGPARRIRSAAEAIHAPAALEEIANRIDAFRPDIVHVHNPYPLISPGVFRLAAGRRIPVVQTVHNYRHVCMAGSLYRDGAACDRCPTVGNPLPGIRHRCYQDSGMASAAMATNLVVNRRAWHHISRFIAVSDHVGATIVKHGLATADRVRVRPNPVTDPGRPAPPQGTGVLFAGRLDPQKGAGVLVRSFIAADIEGTLVIAGDGPDRGEIERLAAEDSRVRVEGLIDRAAVGRLIDRSALVVVPSLWHEPFGLVAAESMARGRAVLATNVGGLPTVVGDDGGWLVEPTEAGLIEGLRRAHSGDLVAAGAAARLGFEARLGPRTATDRLIDIYDECQTPTGVRA